MKTDGTGSTISIGRKLDLWLIVASIFLLVSLTCSIPGFGKSRQATSPVATEEPAAVLSSASIEESTTAPAEAAPPPISFYELYQENVQSGTWSEGEGLVKMLGYFDGEQAPGDVLSDQNVVSDEGTAIFEMAGDYLAANPNAPEKAEIERLMNTLLPDGDLLLPFSQEISEDEISTKVGKLARPRSIPDDDEVRCEDLWRGGFDMSPTGISPVCFDYFNFTAGGTHFRVFIDQNWQLEQNWGFGPNYAQRSTLLGWTREALTAAAEEYNSYPYSAIMPTDIVFNQLAFVNPDTGLPAPRMPMVTNAPRRDKCTIGIFPFSFSFPDTVFHQELAHELFHCFQRLNFDNAMHATYTQRKWWYEGSAEYFSNVVYPDTNAEFAYISMLDADIRNTTVFSKWYDNFLFFQHMANLIGKINVLSVLFHMPAGGGDGAYGNALNENYPGVTDEFYHTFGQGYLDVTIPDTGVTIVPDNPPDVDPVDMSTSNSYQDSTGAYILNWFKLHFPEKYKYTLSMTTNGEGRSSARPSSTTGGWGALPAKINTACGARDYAVLMTNIQPGTTYTLEITVDNRERKEKCDRCVIGRWEVDPESLEPYVRSVIENVATFNSATMSSWTWDFNATTGLLTSEVRDATVDETKLGLSSYDDAGNFHQDMNIVINLSGMLTQAFEAEEIEGTQGATSHKGVLTLEPPQGSATIKTILNGDALPTDTLNSSEIDEMFALNQANYECSEDTLILTPITGMTVAPLTLHKVAED